jgi:hypothetical protein
MTASKIIGGIFPAARVFNINPNNFLKLANARCGLFVVADLLGSETVWLPKYHCPSILQAFPIQNIKFYDVDEDLTPHAPGCRKGDLVVFINYFGLPIPDWFIKFIKDREAWAVEDASMSFFKLPNVYSDFIVYSPRKFLPLPDGGILASNCDVKLDFTLEEPPCDWWVGNLKAMDYRRRHESDNFTWYCMSRNAKDGAPVGYYSMSAYSQALLTSFDTVEIKESIRDNFTRLLSRLKDIALIKELPNEVVPVGFPIKLDNRNPMREKLFRNKVFPPVHWDVDHPLGKTTMTIPCDHRYDVHDMDYVADLITSM